MSIVYESDVNTIYRSDARKVAAEQQAGSVSLAVLDGPYAMQKAAWDRMKVSELPEWYAPHLDDVGRLCAASASLYVWNTAEGWATLHPAIISRGWTFRALVTWDKGLGFMAGKCDVNGLRSWYDVTEVCGFYQREPDWSGLVRSAVAACPDTRVEICRLIGIDSRLLQFWEDGERFPSWPLWLRAWGVLRGPFPVCESMPRVCRYYMQALNTARCASDADIRREWEMMRPVFTCPIGVSNVWQNGQVSGPERLRGEDGATLHPCQKPLAFADRIIRASSRPGERVWVPFGGTCREAVAAEWMARAEPDEARQVVTCEIDEDGRDYLGAVVRQLRGEGIRIQDPKQIAMFGGAA